MGKASGDSNIPQWKRNDILDFQGAMSVKIAVENVVLLFYPFFVITLVFSRLKLDLISYCWLTPL